MLLFFPSSSGGGEAKKAEEECNCYGAGGEGECCRTCADIKAAYRRKGWRLIPAAVPPVSSRHQLSCCLLALVLVVAAVPSLCLAVLLHLLLALFGVDVAAVAVARVKSCFLPAVPLSGCCCTCRCISLARVISTLGRHQSIILFLPHSVSVLPYFAVLLYRIVNGPRLF